MGFFEAAGHQQLDPVWGGGFAQNVSLGGRQAPGRHRESGCNSDPMLGEIKCVEGEWVTGEGRHMRGRDWGCFLALFLLVGVHGLALAEQPGQVRAQGKGEIMLAAGNPQNAAEEIRRCVAEARKTATPASAYVSDPIECEAIAATARFIPLCSWRIFNPFGPTLSSLFLAEVPGTSDRALFFRMLNPFDSEAVLFGLIPRPLTQSSDTLMPTLRRLFGQNGSEDVPLFISLPSHIPTLKESPLSWAQLKELFLLAAARSSEAGNIESTTDRLVRYRTDPWGRASVELEESLKQYEKAKAMAPPAGAKGRMATQGQLDRWWAAVTDPEHVASEISEIRAAWEGATRFQKKGLGDAKGQK